MNIWLNLYTLHFLNRDKCYFKGKMRYFFISKLFWQKWNFWSIYHTNSVDMARKCHLYTKRDHILLHMLHFWQNYSPDNAKTAVSTNNLCRKIWKMHTLVYNNMYACVHIFGEASSLMLIKNSNFAHLSFQVVGVHSNRTRS